MSDYTDEKLKKLIKDIVTSDTADDGAFTHKTLRRELESKLGAEKKSLDEIKDRLKDLYNEVVEETKQHEGEEEEEEEEEEGDEGGGAKKKKKKRGGPRGVRTAFNIFSTEMRIKLKEEQPDLDNKAIPAKLSEVWKALDDEGKKPWNEKHEEDVKRHQSELAAYVPTASDDELEEEKKKEKLKKKKMMKGAPKGARSGYILFSSEKREKVKEENPTASTGEIMQKLAQLWGALTDEEKAPWLAKAEEDKKRYDDEMSKWVPPEDNGEDDDKPKKEKKEKKVGPKGAKSAYIIWSTEERAKLKAENPDLSFKQLAEKLGEKWGKMSESEKEPYTKLADDDKERYNAEYADMVKKGLIEEKVSKKRSRAEGGEPKRKRKKGGSQDGSDAGSDGEIDPDAVLDYDKRASRRATAESSLKRNKLENWRVELFEAGDISEKPGEKSGEYEFLY